MTIQKTNLYHFPWRSGNQFHLHVDGDKFFPAMLNAIEQAQVFVALEMYLVNSGTLLDQFIETLLATAQRGVKVFILLDDFGSRRMKMNDRQKLSHPNINLYFYNPTQLSKLRRSLLRNHRKLLLIDNRIAFTGGAGLTDAFDPRLSGQHFWHDLMVEIHGPCVNDWCQTFIDNWPGDRITLEACARQTSPETDINISTSQLGRVTTTQKPSRMEIKRSFIKHVNSAEHWVYLTTAYFIPSWKIRRALRKAASRGVDVRLILPGPHTDHPAVRYAGRRFYAGLLKHNVRIFEYQPRFSHSKAFLCDQWCSIGSSNLDRWNLLWNLEGNQEINSLVFANILKLMFERDAQESCLELHNKDWHQRPRYRRLLEWFWGHVDARLSRLAIRWRQGKDD